MNREIHVPLRESPEVKSLRATRPANRRFKRPGAPSRSGYRWEAGAPLRPGPPPTCIGGAKA
jgi:hypothetical protein